MVAKLEATVTFDASASFLSVKLSIGLLFFVPLLCLAESERSSSCLARIGLADFNVSHSRVLVLNNRMALSVTIKEDPMSSKTAIGNPITPRTPKITNVAFRTNAIAMLC